MEETITQDCSFESSVGGQAQVPWGVAVPCREWSSVKGTVELFNSTITIGRRFSNDIVVRHPAVSGRHCKLVNDPETKVVWLYDLSTNGTALDGQMVSKGERIMVTNGSEVVLMRTMTDKISYFIYLHSSMKNVRKLGADFVLENKLGHGSFATVYSCRCRKTGKRMAVKCISKRMFANKMQSSQHVSMMDEAAILHSLDHPSIISVHAVYDTDDELQIVMDYMDGGDLFEYVQQMKRDAKAALKRSSRDEDRKNLTKKRAVVTDVWSIEDIKKMFRQLLRVMAYLHSRNVVHRDLKPENVLLCKKTHRVALTDFGLARVIGVKSNMETMCGTPQYVAPEVLNSKNTDGYGVKVDMWSLGVMLYFMLAGSTPFSHLSVPEVLQCVRSGSISYAKHTWSKIDPGARDLVEKLLQIDPIKRLSASQALKHPWIADGVPEAPMRKVKLPPAFNNSNNLQSPPKPSDDQNHGESKESKEKRTTSLNQPYVMVARLASNPFNLKSFGPGSLQASPKGFSSVVDHPRPSSNEKMQQVKRICAPSARMSVVDNPNENIQQLPEVLGRKRPNSNR